MESRKLVLVKLFAGQQWRPRHEGFPVNSVGKESACNTGDLGWEDPLEEGMATYSSILAWRIHRTEEPGVAEVDTTE